MIVAFYSLMVVSVLLYVAAFLYETWTSVIRLRKKRGSEFVHATWEITHTLLVVTLVAFLMTHSSLIVDIAKIAFIPLFIVVFAFIIRAALFLVLFYAKEGKANIGWMDYLFAGTHIVILLGLVIAIIQVVWLLLTADYTVNTVSMNWYMAGLIGLLVVCSAPLIKLYRTKNL